MWLVQGSQFTVHGSELKTNTSATNLIFTKCNILVARFCYGMVVQVVSQIIMTSRKFICWFENKTNCHLPSC